MKTENAEVTPRQRAARITGFKKTLKAFIDEKGVQPAIQQFEFLKTHPNTLLPRKYFNHAETVAIWREVLQDYLQDPLFA